MVPIKIISKIPAIIEQITVKTIQKSNIVLIIKTMFNVIPDIFPPSFQVDMTIEHFLALRHYTG